MSARRQLLHDWAVEVVREGVARGLIAREMVVRKMTTADALAILQFVAERAWDDLSEDAVEILREAGLKVADVGVRVARPLAERVTGQILGGALDAIADRLRRR